MNYKELQIALKELREQGHVVPALNSKKEVLESAYNKILDTIASTEKTVEIVKVATEIEPAIRVIQVVAYAIALIKFLGLKLNPYIKKGLNTALRIAVTAAWIFQKWILPKLILGAYLVGVWGLTAALKIVRRGREVAIA